ncbi:LON peptidase substrate-binding domain-containing protein [Jannaschia sp. M317]|uniref:LON peptidase substrate-binding domain-containing protein n=1 Tax=Jannaschia sp. M317 TaxID=2867011 RepID=UPI0021A75EEA|nr:LON peptidase substrate-binding domain-containing protein [Jannaschia sp. M317]UWQ18143.1 LON peptidase substrate-binding domain-containing protein [Jannaschia sp. M317]
MIRPADLPPTIPVFPLPGALLLPRARLPLHIFEPRYLQMIDDCLKTDHRLIGMVQPRAQKAGDGRTLQSIGCAGRLTQLSETEDRRYMITLAGVSRYRITRELSGFEPYLKADVSWEGFDRDLGKPEVDTEFDRPAFLDLLDRYFDDQNLSTDWDSLKDADEELLLNSLSMLCPFDTEEKQALLEAPSLSTRRETVVTLMEFALRGGNSDETLQ